MNIAEPNSKILAQQVIVYRYFFLLVYFLQSTDFKNWSLYLQNSQNLLSSTFFPRTLRPERTLTEFCDLEFPFFYTEKNSVSVDREAAFHKRSLASYYRVPNYHSRVQHPVKEAIFFSV
uniref:Uncharacterized protein n=1 Tax=Cacopsylla melanoneura TaxID=428564 RepID=A0A8D8V8F3_9HEMI